MPKRVEKERFTRFGRRIYDEMDRRNMKLAAIIDTLGVYPDHWRRMVYKSNKNTSIYIPMVFKIGELLDISPVELLILLYEEQVIASDLTESEIKFYCQLLKVFDGFYRLNERDQDLAVSTIDKWLATHEKRTLSDEQEQFIDRLRIHPIHEAGNGLLLEERMKKASVSQTEA